VLAVARNFQFVSCDAATQALAEIETPPKEDASVTDQLRAEFSFHARLKIKGAEYAAAAQNWTMGGEVYVF
jgi:hypothetical protein